MGSCASVRVRRELDLRRFGCLFTFCRERSLCSATALYHQWKSNHFGKKGDAVSWQLHNPNPLWASAGGKSSSCSHVILCWRQKSSFARLFVLSANKATQPIAFLPFFDQRIHFTRLGFSDILIITLNIRRRGSFRSAQ